MTLGTVNFEVRLIPKGTILHRISIDNVGATEFSDCNSPIRRFGPFHGADGKCVPTLYCADEFEGAIMETVFHDVDLTVPNPIVFLSDFKRHRRSFIVTLQDISVARLDDEALPNLGLTRSMVIDTPPSTYMSTVEWAKAAHAQKHAGVIWNSRRHPEACAVVFFGGLVDRRRDLDVAKSPRNLLDPESYESLMKLAIDHNITVIH